MPCSSENRTGLLGGRDLMKKQRQTQELKMRDVHIRIPESIYHFLVEESVQQGISIALYLTNILMEQQSLEAKEKNKERRWKETSKSESFHIEMSELLDEELEKMLTDFEQKYQLDSETFYQLYRTGKAPENIEDKILWGSLCALKKEKDDLE